MPLADIGRREARRTLCAISRYESKLSSSLPPIVGLAVGHLKKVSHARKDVLRVEHRNSSIWSERQVRRAAPQQMRRWWDVSFGPS